MRRRPITDTSSFLGDVINLLFLRPVAREPKATPSLRRQPEPASEPMPQEEDRSADRTIADARSEAEQILFEAKTHAEVTRQRAEGELADLARQRDKVTAQLNQLREMLSGLAGVSVSPEAAEELGGEAVDAADAEDATASADDSDY